MLFVYALKICHHILCKCETFTQNSKEYFDEIGGTYSIDGIVVPLLNTAKSLLITCIYMVVTKLENHQA